MTDRIAILGTTALFADAVRTALQHSGVEVASYARLSDGALAQIDGDVVLLDAGSAADALPWIRRMPGRVVIPVLEAADEEHVSAVIEAGASGWIERDATLARLVRELRSPRRSERMLGRVGRHIHTLARDLHRPANALTARELQVLQLAAQNLATKEIATRLGVGADTIKTHLHKVYAKLGVGSRRQAITRGMRLGLLRDLPKAVRAQRTAADVIQAIFASAPRTYDELLAALEATRPAVEDFERLASTADALTLYRSLQPLLERYGPPVAARRFTPFDFDYYRFLGHELLVTLMMVLLRERRWTTAGDLLDECFTVPYAAGTHKPRRVTFGYASEQVESLPAHAELLESRHKRNFDDFVAADYFLFLRGEIEPDIPRKHGFEWRPWSTARMRVAPWILRHPKELAAALRVPDVATLRARLLHRAPRLAALWRSAAWRNPITRADLDVR
jgi:DNA-binding NarL/FixJ family response regulator